MTITTTIDNFNFKEENSKRILVPTDWIFGSMEYSASSSGVGGFFLICMVHSAVALTCGGLLMFYSDEASVFSHGKDHARRLAGSTPQDQLLIRTSDSFSGLLLSAVGLLLFMVAFVKDSDFQGFFAKGCALLHVAMAAWRFWFERKVQVLAEDWARLVFGDIALGVSWVLFLVYSWRDKYD